MSEHATAEDATLPQRPDVDGVQAAEGTEGLVGPYRPAPGGVAEGLVALGSEDAPACSDGSCPI